MGRGSRGPDPTAVQLTSAPIAARWWGLNDPSPISRAQGPRHGRICMLGRGRPGASGTPLPAGSPTSHADLVGVGLASTHLPMHGGGEFSAAPPIPSRRPLPTPFLSRSPLPHLPLPAPTADGRTTVAQHPASFLESTGVGGSQHLWAPPPSLQNPGPSASQRTKGSCVTHRSCLRAWGWGFPAPPAWPHGSPLLKPPTLLAFGLNTLLPHSHPPPPLLWLSAGGRQESSRGSSVLERRAGQERLPISPRGASSLSPPCPRSDAPPPIH